MPFELPAAVTTLSRAGDDQVLLVAVRGLDPVGPGDPGAAAEVDDRGLAVSGEKKPQLVQPPGSVHLDEENKVIAVLVTDPGTEPGQRQRAIPAEGSTVPAQRPRLTVQPGQRSHRCGAIRRDGPGGPRSDNLLRRCVLVVRGGCRIISRQFGQGCWL